MTKRRLARMALRYFRRRFRELHPFEVEAALLNRCSLHCIYCRYPDLLKPEMTTAQWIAIIRGFARLGTLRFKLHGGEPTLRPDFRELSAEIRSAGMIAAAVTNGTLIPGRPELIDHLDELIVSLDSPRPEINDRLRGDGSHEAAVRTLDIARHKGIKTAVNMVLTKWNLIDLESMLEFCEARGILMNAQPIVFGGRYYLEEGRDLQLTGEEIRDVHERLLLWKRRGRRVVFSKYAYRKVLEWPDLTVLSVRGEGPSSCVAGRDYIRLECDGDVLPCCQYNADFTPLNILRDGLEKSLRRARDHNCGGCWLAYYNERAAVFKLKPGAVWEVLRRG